MSFGLGLGWFLGGFGCVSREGLSRDTSREGPRAKGGGRREAAGEAPPPAAGPLLSIDPPSPSPLPPHAHTPHACSPLALNHTSTATQEYYGKALKYAEELQAKITKKDEL